MPSIGILSSSGHSLAIGMFVPPPRYEVHRRIGSGGFGSVYEVRDRERGGRLALKSLAQLDAPALYAFKREFRSLADVTHENLVQLYELSSADDAWFFTMELVEGVDWLTHVRGGRAIEGARVPEVDAKTMEQNDGEMAALPSSPPKAAIEGPQPIGDGPRLRGALMQLIAGLRALHDAGIVHRDVKPSNVLVTETGRVVILDFGIARRVAEGISVGTDLDLSGTPEYMAPEQAIEAASNPAIDVYAVGVMLFEALTGERPFVGAPVQILMQKQVRAAPRVRDRVPNASPDLDALVAEMLALEGAERPTLAEIADRLGRRDEDRDGRRTSLALHASQPTLASGDTTALTILGGRERELSVLRAAMGRVEAGQPATVRVRGPSGIGKSAMVRAFLRSLPPRTVVLAGRCYERESVPYKAFDSVVDALSRYLRRLPNDDVAALLPREAATLAQVFPVLQRVPAVMRAPRRARASLDPQQLRTRAFAAMRELLARIGDHAPVVVFIDDVQWGDADSAALLAELTSPPDPAAILLIVACRSEDEARSPLLHALDASRPLGSSDQTDERIDVGALPPAEMRALADRLLAGSHNAATRAELLADESKGNPFFLMELVRAAEVLSTATSSPTVVTLDWLLQQRAAALPEPARRLLTAVCVAGKPTHRDVLVRAAGLDPKTEPAALAALRSGHLTRTSGGRGEVLEAYHDRIREAVVASLDEDDLAQCHRALADAIQLEGVDDPEELHAHYRAAGAVAEATRFAELAADRATLALAFDRAAALFRSAIQLRGGARENGTAAPGDAGVATLSNRLGDVLGHAGRGAEAAAAYETALASARSDSERFELRRKIVEQLLLCGEHARGLMAASEVLQSAGLRLATSPFSAIVQATLLRIFLFVRGRAFRVRESEAIAPATLRKIDVCNTMSVGLALVDNARAAPFAERQLLLALRAGDVARIGRGLVMASTHATVAGWTDYARTLIDQGRKLAATIDDAELDALLLGATGFQLCIHGEFRPSIDPFDRAIAMCTGEVRDRPLGPTSRWVIDTAYQYRLVALYFLGEVRELSRSVPALLRDANERGDLYLATALRIGETSSVWLFADDQAGALEHVDEAIVRWPNDRFLVQHWQAMHSRIQATLYARDVAGAHDEMERQWPRLQRAMLMRIGYIGTKAHALRGRVALAVAGAQLPLEDSIRRARWSAARVHAVGRPWSHALAMLLEAGAHARAREDAAALAKIDSSIAALDRLDMKLYAQAARRARGLLIGGDEGAAAVAQVESAMASDGVRRPAQIADMLVPGFAR